MRSVCARIFKRRKVNSFSQPGPRKITRQHYCVLADNEPTILKSALVQNGIEHGAADKNDASVLIDVNWKIREDRMLGLHPGGLPRQLAAPIPQLLLRCRSNH